MDIEDFGVNSDIGYPSLPQISFNIIIPDSKTVPKIKLEKSIGKEMKLEKRLYPVQQPWPKSRPLSERPFSINKTYYKSDGNQEPRITVSTPFIIGGVSGVTITIRPFWYNPKSNALLVAETLAVSIELPDKQKINDVKTSPSFNSIIDAVFINSSEANVNSSPKAGENYLIISSPALVSSLSRLVTYRRNRGFTVDVFTTDVTGTTTTAIKAFIQNRYNSADTRPSFILLVGDDAEIPAWPTTTQDNPWTDLYYGTLDGSDYFPDAHVGRFSASTASQIVNMANKTVVMDSSVDYVTKNAVFLASQDNYSVSEATHNYVIATDMEPRGYACTRRYCHTTSATTAQVLSDLALGQVFCIYSGHGSETSWADGPAVSQSQVQALTNALRPFVYSFSCLTGSFRSTAECFGESWMRSAAGASSYWGSSVTSYWNEDDILERRIFDAIYSGDITLSCPSFNRGKIELYNYYGNTAMIQRYFEMYNLLGDPALAVYNNWTQGVSLQFVSSSIQILSGNGDAYINPGERISLSTIIMNRGTQDASNVSATLSTTDAYVTINDNSSQYGSITARGGTSPSLDPFGVTVQTSCPTPRTVPLRLTITESQGGTWTADVSIIVQTSSTISGHVFTLQGNLPLAGARVHWSGPSADSTTTDASGAYSFVALDGSYQVSASALEYFPSTPQTVVTPPSVANIDFHLGRPVLTITPEQFNVTVPVGNSIDRALVLSNAGSESLTYSLSIEESKGKTVPAESLYTAEHFIQLPKDAPDTRIGKPAAKGRGGPDMFGYRWVDSDEPGGPVYQWEDISSTGQRLSLSGDDVATSVSLAFPFPFYGTNYSSMYVCSNGFVSLGSSSTAYSNQPIPSTSAPNNFIAPFWDDLYIGSGSNVYFQGFSDRAIIQFQSLSPYSGTGSFTFQIVINSRGKVLFYYRTMTGTLTSATVGIENGSGSDGLRVAYNTSYIHNNLAICFKTAPDWLSLNPESGTVPSALSRTVSVHIATDELVPGNYAATILLQHNDPRTINPKLVPVTMTVTEGLVLRMLPAITGVSAIAADRAGTIILENSMVGSPGAGKATGSRFQLFLK